MRKTIKRYDELFIRTIRCPNNTDWVTLKNSCPLKQNFILFGLISQETSLPLVPFGTLTSMKTSSIVCAQFPQEVFDGTTPLFSSEWPAILENAQSWYLHDTTFSQLHLPLPNKLVCKFLVMRLGARVIDYSAGVFKFSSNFLRFGTRRYCFTVEEMSVSSLYRIK